MIRYNNCHPNAERERAAAQAHLYAAQSMTAASELFFQVIHSGEAGNSKGAKNKNATKKPKPPKRPKARKPDSQMKVKHFFQTKVNEDGYPMGLCEYEPMERRHVYRPPGYGENKHNRWFHEGAHCSTCHLKPCITFEYFQETDEFFFDQNIAKEKSVAVCVADTTWFLQKLYCKTMNRRYLKKEIPPSCIRERVDSLRNYADEDGEDDVESRLSIDTQAIYEFCTKERWNNKKIPLHIYYKNQRFKDDEEKRLASEKLGSSEGDSQSDSDEDSDDDDDDFPLSVLRDHQLGDPPVEEKIAHYRTKKAQQKAVELKNSKAVV